MSKLHYFTLLLLVVLLAVVSGWILESFEDKTPFLKQEVRHVPDYYLEKVSIRNMDNSGKLSHLVRADYLVHYPDDDSIEMQKPYIEMYQPNRIHWLLTAEKGISRRQQQLVNLQDKVHIEKRNHSEKPLLILNADDLQLDTEKRIITSQAAIQLIQAGNQIQAVGMKAQLNNGKIEFLSQVRGEYALGR